MSAINNKATEKPIRILFTGDLMTGGEFGRQLFHKEVSPQWPFEEICRIFEENDLVISNLECPIAAGSCIRPDKSSILDCYPEIFPIFKQWHFDIISIANNHIHDFGDNGARRTIEMLEKNGIEPFGYHIKNKVDKTWIVKEIGSISIGVAAFTSDEPWVKAKINKTEIGLSFYSFSNLKKTITALRPICDFLVIILHWGFEHHEYPSSKQMEIAEFCINNGADAIIGHHPHVVQGWKVFEGKPAFFSLGHLFFSDFSYRGGELRTWKDVNRKGILVGFTINRKSLSSFQIIPIQQSPTGKLGLMLNKEKESFDSNLDILSEKLKLPLIEYSEFWIDYHYKFKSKILHANISRTLFSKEMTLFEKSKRIIKILVLITRLKFNRILKKIPENKRCYY